MSASAAELVEQLASADFNLRARALAGLVALGRAATPALLPLLVDSDARLRALAAQALAEIGDPDNAEAFALALRDPDAQVRGRAAQGLARIGDPRAIAALIQTLHDLPDVLHDPATLATHLLMHYGAAALPHVVPLLQSPDAATRGRAWLVVYGVVAGLAEVGDWQALWLSLGSYHPDAAEPTRAAAAALWLDWTKRQAGE
jgi:HEAT repeat protein